MRPEKRAVLALSMPLPPASDHINGAQLSWRKRAVAEIAGQLLAAQDPIAPHARLRVLAGIIHGRALVEIIPAAVGILVDAGLIQAAGTVTDIETRWDKTIEPGRLQIEIAPAIPPVRRIGAAVRQRIREKTQARWAKSRAALEPQAA